jgi:MinD-like ATPase involved in chromosome partitioning or flagellar assembly
VTAIAVVAGKAAPGATTVANALTLAFAEPVLLIDADPAGGDVVPGLLPGRASTDTGLLSWLVATRRLAAIDATAQLPQHALSLPEAGDAWVLAGLQGPSQAGVLASGGWSRLATTVERCGPVLGRAVIVDIGRLNETSGWPVVDACDLVLLVVRPTARSVQGALAAVQQIRRRLGDLDRTRLVVCGAGPYTPDQVALALEFERADRVDHIPADPRGAAALVDGSAATVFGLTRTRLVRAAGQLADRITAEVSIATSAADLTFTMPTSQTNSSSATGWGSRP